MRTTSTTILVAVLAIAVAGTVVAQESTDFAAERAAIQKDRNAIVAANLPLTTDQTAAFWPVYKEYRAEMAKVGDRMEKLIKDYAAAYNATITDDQAAAMLKEFLAIQKEVVRVKEQFAPRFGAVLPAKSVMRFYQIENKLDGITGVSLMTQIPLAK